MVSLWYELVLHDQGFTLYLMVEPYGSEWAKHGPCH